jgi:hypothetical protein
MNKREAKKIAYSDHKITYRDLKVKVEIQISDLLLKRPSKVNPQLTRKYVQDLYLSWFNEYIAEDKLDKVVNSTMYNVRNNKLTLSSDGLSMANMMVEYF